MTWPFFADALTTAWWYRGSRDVAEQMALIDLETLAITGAVQGLTNVVVSRERPYGRDCGSAEAAGRRARLREFHALPELLQRSFGVQLRERGADLRPSFPVTTCWARPGTRSAARAATRCAATTAFFRVVGDVHYTTDVLTGALVGSLIGYGVPLLHYAQKSGAGLHVGEVRVDPFPLPAVSGCSGILMRGPGCTGSAALLCALGRRRAGGQEPTERRRARPDTRRTGGSRRDRQPAPPVQPRNPATRPRARGHADPPLGLFPTSEDALIDPRMQRSWGVAPPRTFVATTIDIGFLYVRPRVSLGYGRPFTSWFGIDVNPIAATGGLGAYGGLRVEIPHFDVRAGSRYYSAFHHTYLVQQEELQPPRARDERRHAGTHAHARGRGRRVASGSGRATCSCEAAAPTSRAFPRATTFFEETLHVIVRPPVVWRARVAYTIALGAFSQHSLGLAVDLLDIPKRDDSITLRAGPVLKVVLSRRVEIRGSFVVPSRAPTRSASSAATSPNSACATAGPRNELAACRRATQHSKEKSCGAGRGHELSRPTREARSACPARSPHAALRARAASVCGRDRPRSR